MAFSCRVLLVEHDPDQMILLSSWLGKQPGIIMLPPLRSGAEALERIWADPPDLLLLDANAEDMDGLSVLDALYGAPCSPPVLMLLSRRDRQLVSAAVALGVKHVMEYPLDLEVLLRRIQTYGMDGDSLALRLRWLGVESAGLKFDQCRQAAEALIQLKEPKPLMKVVFHQVADQWGTSAGNVSKNVERVSGIAHAKDSDYYRSMFGHPVKAPSSRKFLMGLTEGLRTAGTGS
ncbi:MAG: response regulator [Oscillospiraceae bacterium]|nr:response regulator [Oscillospiraceae bacterium]